MCGLVMGAEVKHHSVADGSDLSPTGQLAGMNVCECLYESGSTKGSVAQERLNEGQKERACGHPLKLPAIKDLELLEIVFLH